MCLECRHYLGAVVNHCIPSSSASFSDHHFFQLAILGPHKNHSAPSPSAPLVVFNHFRYFYLSFQTIQAHLGERRGTNTTDTILTLHQDQFHSHNCTSFYPSFWPTHTMEFFMLWKTWTTSSTCFGTEFLVMIAVKIWNTVTRACTSKEISFENSLILNSCKFLDIQSSLGRTIEAKCSRIGIVSLALVYPKLHNIDLHNVTHSLIIP